MASLKTTKSPAARRIPRCACATANRAIRNINKNNVRGIRIRKARLKKGYSLRQLSEVCNISQVCLTRIELGNTGSNVKILAKLAKALDRPLEYIGAFDFLPEDCLQEKLAKAILMHGHFKTEAAAAIGIDVRTFRSFMKGKNIKNASLVKIKNYIAETENKED